MPQFRYKARDKSGVAVTGVVQADTPKAVSLSLRQLGYHVVFVEEFAGLPALIQIFRQRMERAGPMEVVLFTRQVAMMVKAGLPLVDSIHGCSLQTTSAAFRKELVLLVEELKGGASFSEALAKHPRLFSNFHISMVRAGEAAGILDQVLDRLASIGEEEMELKGRVQSALVYPCLLVVMSVGIVVFLMTAILPKFVGIFEEAGAQLPLPTVILLTASRILQQFWLLIPVGGFFGFMALRRYAASPKGQYRLHGLVLKMPIIGPIIHKTILTRFTRIMGSLLKSGIQAVAALTITQEVVGNEVARQALAHVREAVIGGSNLADPFRMSAVFPSTLVQMVAVGEKTGTLDEILLHLSNFYDTEVERELRTLTSTLEPLLLLVMGLIVGFIALSVLLPIFQLVKVFRK